MDVAELRRRVDGIRWHHAIDLGHGVVTPGQAGAGTIPLDTLPDVTGRSVLDVGAWDGFYSFHVERAGAARVVALDHYAWCVDLDARAAYWDRCRAEGVLPDQSKDETEFWRGDDLPGRRGFDLAKEVLGSAVEPYVADFTVADLDDLGAFDVVLYLGVLYHMKEPLTALERLRRVTKEVAVIETEAVWVRHHEHERLLAFYPGDELSADFGNWYAPNEAGLHALCRAAGFSRSVTVAGPPPLHPLGPLKRALLRKPPLRSLNYRLIVHAFP
ncbi:MAG TPA: DUF1698 domain-containing protein [Acidimicrobiales bacterium]|nr:DUF1698 domain-containing protein [Acidimicrobiales bacterium]